MNKEQIKYKDLIERGFKRTDIEDNVYFNQMGYGYFVLTLVLQEGILFQKPNDRLKITHYKLEIEWTPEDRTARLINMDSVDGGIFAEHQNLTLAEVDSLIKFYRNAIPKAKQE